jgi:twinkle protein
VLVRSPQNALQAPQALNMREVCLEAMSELARPYPSFRLPEWEQFNKATGGFRMREFTILCGSTGAGKTTFLANLSAQLLKAGTKHFVMSVETGHTDFMKRILSVLEGYDVNQGEAVSADRLAKMAVKHMPLLQSGMIEFSLYDNRVPVEQLLYDLRYMHDIHGCKIAMIDNLNFFMEVTRAADAVIEMDRVIHELIIFCKQVDMHVIMVMHPKKPSGTRDTRIESEYEIKGSSTAVQEAHNVFLFNRPKRDDVEAGTRNAYERDLTIAKMRRRGQFAGHTLVFDSVGTRYFEKGMM